MKRITYIFQILLFLALPFTVSAKKKPSWVKQRPNDTNYYMGIGVGHKTDSKIDYMKEARSQALKQMSSEIKVTISANSVLHQLESNDNFKEEYESKINTSVHETLEGYEIFTWENKHEYWVMTRLSKQGYKRMKKMQLDQAKMMASAYYDDAQKAMGNNDPASALALLAKAALSIKNNLEDDLTHRTVNGTNNIGTQITSLIQDIFRAIEISPSQSSYQLQFSKQMEAPIVVKATMLNKRGDKIPIANFPLEFSFTKGDGLIVPSSKTNYGGEAKVSISRLISNKKSQQIEVKFDSNHLVTDATNEEEKKFLSLFFPSNQLPSAQISIHIQKAKAYLVTHEKIFNKSSSSNIFTRQIQKELNENFFTFTTNKSEADFIVKIQSDFSQGETKKGKGYALYLVYANFSLSIRDAKSGLELFTDHISGIKGARPGNVEYALKDARVKLLAQYKTNIAPRLEEIDM